MEVPVLDVIDETEVPPTLTLAAVAPVKFVPVIVNVAPGHPDVGEIEVIVGGNGQLAVQVVNCVPTVPAPAPSVYITVPVGSKI